MGGGLFLSQSLYMKEVLSKYTKLNDSATPVDHKIGLFNDGAVLIASSDDGQGRLNLVPPFRKVVNPLV